jgi:hypothetical protein
MLVTLITVRNREARRRRRHVSLLRQLGLTRVSIGRARGRSAGISGVSLVAWLGLVDWHAGRRGWDSGGGGRVRL